MPQNQRLLHLQNQRHLSIPMISHGLFVSLRSIILVMERYLVKYAWKCRHEQYGDITSFLVTPKQEIAPYTLGYTMDETDEEVIRFPSDSMFVDAILSKLSFMGNNQWSAPTFGELVEFDFDMADFFDEEFYQDNYGRDVLFHTHLSLIE